MNNLSKNGTCGISTGVLRCLAIRTRHNNGHEQLVQERTCGISTDVLRCLAIGTRHNQRA